MTQFSRGFAELLQRYNIQLVGGDTTHGPLSITVNVYGFLTRDCALKRSAAKPGELIYVTGTIGDAGLGLKKILASIDHEARLQTCVSRLNRPTPRLEVGMALAGISQCAIDISDGLLADLSHITQHSGCAAKINIDQIPLSSELQQFYAGDIDWQQILSSGDDYELCFTLSPDKAGSIDDIARQTSTKISCIGEIQQGSGVQCLLADGTVLHTSSTGYNHFS